MAVSEPLRNNRPDDIRNELARIFAKGFLRHIRMEQAAPSTSASGASQSVNDATGAQDARRSPPKAARRVSTRMGDASKNELLAASAHGSLSRELTDTEPRKEEAKCQ